MLKGRILCMTSYLDYVIIGTNERIIHVYEACAKTHAHALSALQDSILCLTLVPRDRKLVAGLANGKLAVYNADQIIKQGILASFKFVSSKNDILCSLSEKAHVVLYRIVSVKKIVSKIFFFF